MKSSVFQRLRALLSGARLTAGLLGVGLAGLASAYTHMGTNVSTNNGLLFWGGNSMTYRINSNLAGAQEPNLVPGSDPVGAITGAFSLWHQAAGLHIERGPDTVITTANPSDRVNLVTMADTPGNRALLAGEVGKAFITFDGNNQIWDTDIVFHPDHKFTTLDNPLLPGQAGAHPLLGSSIKLVGHCLSLMHSPIQSSVMMRYGGGRLVSAEAGRLGTFLTEDDLIAANVAYPQKGLLLSRGTISGTVTLNGTTKVYGAHVVAVSADTGVVVAGNMTLGANQGSLAGRYKIQGLPPGRYHVYAEPIDAPYSSNQWEGVYSLGDYWGGSFTGGYQTTFHGSSSAPQGVTVSSGGTATVNLAVQAGSPAIVPILNGLFPANTLTSDTLAGQIGQVAASDTPLVLAPGEKRWAVVTGSGLAGLPAGGLTCSDGAITITAPAGLHGTTPEGVDYVIFQIQVPAGSPEGPRNLIFRNGAEVAVMTGAVYVDTNKPVWRNGADPQWLRCP